MRTLVDIGDKEIQALDQLAAEKNVSRAALIRRAIDELLQKQAGKAVADAFNLWGPEAKDGLILQEELRQEW
jgi:predicted transcriptional regulator